jgi:hypothetical protein
LKRKAVFLIILLVAAGTCHAGESDWRFKFFGIDVNDFKGRSIFKIALGVGASFLAHEAGHFIAGYAVGHEVHMRHGAAWADDYENMSTTEKEIFHGGGFIAQVLVGTVITAIPATRHSDFSLGFNAATASVVGGYAFKTNNESHPHSDVAQMRYGAAAAVTTAAYAAALTYINLDKYRWADEMATDEGEQ